jgi:3-methyladenine DNA glycosylase AlkD
VKQGFSFYSEPPERVLAIWDALWQQSPHGDVLFAALEYYSPVVRKQVPEYLWSVVRTWADRVDNWCHADNLSAIYSRILEYDFGGVYPQLEKWNQEEGEWLRRVSLVSLIHYTGKNAVFLSPEKVLPLVTRCLDDHRHGVDMAVGWVLREMGSVYRLEIDGYLEEHAARLSSAAFSRALEKRTPAERAAFRAKRALAAAAGL